MKSIPEAAVQRCSENMQHRRTPVPKCDFNKVALQLSLHKKRSFLLRISSVNITKSARNCVFCAVFITINFGRTPMQKCDFNKVTLLLLLLLLCNFIEMALQHWCFPVSLLHIFRTPFLKNTSGRLLLPFLHSRRSRELSNEP